MEDSTSYRNEALFSRTVQRDECDLAAVAVFRITFEYKKQASELVGFFLEQHTAVHGDEARASVYSGFDSCEGCLG